MDKKHVSIAQSSLRAQRGSAHANKSFFVVRSSVDLSELAKAAKKKLQSVSVWAGPPCGAPSCYVSSPDLCPLATLVQLSNHLFEELAMDVYDEVDRRETDAG